ncbi:hypothetical protein GCM10010465_12790 [Actinomadura fibrosa]
MALFVLQACNVYHKSAVSVEEAVQAQERVKIVTTDNVFYEFKRLQRKDDQLLGVTKPGSDTAGKLKGYEQIFDGKNVMIPLDENRIESVYLRNKSKSNLLSYGIPAVLVGGALVIVAASSVPVSGY